MGMARRAIGERRERREGEEGELVGLGGTAGGLGRREVFGAEKCFVRLGGGARRDWRVYSVDGGIFIAYIRERHGMYGTGSIVWGFFSNNEISILA